MTHEFTTLPYSYDALEPWIDAMTMEIHHSRHYKAYHTNFLAAIQGTPLAEKSLEDIFSNMKDVAPAVRNNGGGFWNHRFFWTCMTPKGKAFNPNNNLGKAVLAKWGSLDAFKEKFAQAAATRFGSGWAWLVIKADGQLEITSTANQDNPLMSFEVVQGQPILGLDVWEHAYYLKYQNKRPDYVSGWWNIVDWDFAQKQFEHHAK